MIKAIQVAITLIFTSFFFFPFYFTFLPAVNTKMMMAAAGLAVMVVNLARERSARIDKDFFMLTLMASAVSLVSFISMTINNTPDGSYLSYVISMWVWLAAAYFVVNCIKWTHGAVSIERICYYLIAVGALQCILAIAIDRIETVKTFIDSILLGEGFMGKNETRLYGLGCALDVAGSRFACLLVMIAFLLPRVVEKNKAKTHIFFLLLAFCIIAVIGNVIGRTTTIGLALAIIYLGFVITKQGVMPTHSQSVLRRWVISFFLGAICISTLLYHTNIQWRENLEFGFEGFFSLIETGRWEVRSNDMLSHQFVFPENGKSWIIGDGYFGSTEIDPYYTGDHWEGFYKGSDVGYSRFIYYFGLSGLAIFSCFLVKVCQVCMKRHKEYQYLFAFLLLMNFILWLKVSTDIFLVFALFLCISKEENEEYERLVAE